MKKHLLKLGNLKTKKIGVLFPFLGLLTGGTLVMAWPHISATRQWAWYHSLTGQKHFLRQTPPTFCVSIEAWVRKIPWRRKWQASPVFLPGKSHGRRSLVGCSPWVARSWTRLSDFTFSFHFHALEKATATHSSVLAWKIPWTEEPGGLQSMGR